MLAEVEKEVKKVEEKVKVKEESFGGMKKGFFSSVPSKPKEKIQEVKKPEKPANPLEIPEVQQAMKMNNYLSQTKN